MKITGGEKPESHKDDQLFDKITELLPIDFTFKTGEGYFTKEGTLFVNHYKLMADQKEFVPVFNASSHLQGYHVSKIYKKDGLIWMVFEMNKGSREPASEIKKGLKRIFISADHGIEWSELPGIIKKDI